MERIEAKSRKEAWTIADAIFPTDYEEDATSSAQAGYKVYRSRVDWYDYICDLGDRLEINLHSGKTVNVWIVEPKPEYSEYQLDDALSVISDAIYEIDDKVNYKLAKAVGIKEARNTLYDAYAKIRAILDDVNPSSNLYRKYNLNEA